MPSDTPRKALLDCLLTSHPHQRIRMMMASFASLVMMCCAALMNLLARRHHAHRLDAVVGC